MGIYTSRYSNKELADGKYYCVGISIGTAEIQTGVQTREPVLFTGTERVYAENELGRF